MIVKTSMVILILSTILNVAAGTSYSQVHVESDVVPYPIEYYQYGAPYTQYVSPQLSRLNALPAVNAYPPCGTPCIISGQSLASVQPLAPSANVISYNAPVPNSVPVVISPNKQERTGYEYSYVVYDDSTGDHKAQREHSDGAVVRGEYSFLQPDGYVREVQYVADDVQGFNAIVKNFLPVSLDKKEGNPKESSVDCHEDTHESVKIESNEETKDKPLKEEVSKETGSKEVSNKDESIDEVSKQDASKEESSKEEVSKDSAPKDDASKDETPKEGTSKEVASNEGAPNTEASKENAETIENVDEKMGKEGSIEISSKVNSDDTKKESNEAKENSSESNKKSNEAKEITIESKENSNQSKNESSEGKDTSKGSNENTKEEIKENARKESTESKETPKADQILDSGAKTGNIEVILPYGQVTQELITPQEEYLVPYPDIIRCIQTAINRNQKPAPMKEVSSPLTYIILNKPC